MLLMDIKNNAKARIIRDGIVIYNGKLKHST